MMLHLLECSSERERARKGARPGAQDTRRGEGMVALMRVMAVDAATSALYRGTLLERVAPPHRDGFRRAPETPALSL